MILSADSETFRCASCSARDAAASAIRLGKETTLWAWSGNDRTPASAQLQAVASRKEFPNVCKRGFSILPPIGGASTLGANVTGEHGRARVGKKGKCRC